VNLQEVIDMSYIHPDAHGSYRQWWSRQISTYALYFAYRHLNISALNYVPRVPYRYKHTRGWIRPWDISTSGESSFRQNGYDGKEIDEEAQSSADWRERKHFKKDKSKRYKRRSCPKWVKRQCNKEYRAWQRDLIQRDKFEEIGSKTRKDFFDPWIWD
jgi:hypothetical protein